MKRRLPDFIIGGAPRCGTSWLYELADIHPEIQMARPRKPEPKFFLDDDLFRRGLNYYSEHWFADIEPSIIAGEKSTNYLESPTATARIGQYLPKVKLVFILRDPVERALSNYRWSRMNGLETLDFDTAVERELGGGRPLADDLRHAKPFAYLERGLYHRALTRCFARVPREQVLILQYEKIGDAVQELTERLHGFLGVEPRPQDADQLGIVNAATLEEGIDMSAETLNRLKRYFRSPNRELANLIGKDFELERWQ